MDQDEVKRRVLFNVRADMGQSFNGMIVDILTKSVQTGGMVKHGTCRTEHKQL